MCTQSKWMWQRFNSQRCLGSKQNFHKVSLTKWYTVKLLHFPSFKKRSQVKWYKCATRMLGHEKGSQYHFYTCSLILWINCQLAIQDMNIMEQWWILNNFYLKRLVFITIIIITPCAFVDHHRLGILEYLINKWGLKSSSKKECN